MTQDLRRPAVQALHWTTVRPSRRTAVSAGRSPSGLSWRHCASSRRPCPEAPTVLVVDDEPELRDASFYPAVNFLAKPFSGDALLSLVRRVLAAGAEPAGRGTSAALPQYQRSFSSRGVPGVQRAGVLGRSTGWSNRAPPAWTVRPRCAIATVSRPGGCTARRGLLRQENASHDARAWRNLHRTPSPRAPVRGRGMAPQLNAGSQS
jgi:hypothetical protein